MQWVVMMRKSVLENELRLSLHKYDFIRFAIYFVGLVSIRALSTGYTTDANVIGE